MLIQYKTTKSRRHVSDRIGQALIDRGIAQIYQTREMRATVPAPAVAPAPIPTVTPTAAPAVDASAPYGLKKDGTPKKAPGRSSAEK